MNEPYEATYSGWRYYRTACPPALRDLAETINSHGTIWVLQDTGTAFSARVPERLAAFYESGRGSTEDWAAIRSAFRLGGLKAALPLVP